MVNNFGPERRNGNGHSRHAFRQGPKKVDLYIIADYGDTGAFAEVHSRLRRNEWDSFSDTFRDIVPINVPAFSTLSTGFWLRQMGVENSYPGMAIFSNTAPRGDGASIRWEGDERQRLLYGRLSTGVELFVVSSGYNWSFLKDELVELRDLDIQNFGSQFRSRDLYPQAVNEVLKGNKDLLGIELDSTQLPDVPLNRIAWVDGYGNIKLTTRRSQVPKDLTSSTNLIARIRGGTSEPLVRNHLAGTISEKGELGLLEGSSGGGDPYLELVKRGGRAIGEFGNVQLDDATVFELRPYLRSLRYDAYPSFVPTK